MSVLLTVVFISSPFIPNKVYAQYPLSWKMWRHVLLFYSPVLFHLCSLGIILLSVCLNLQPYLPVSPVTIWTSCYIYPGLYPSSSPGIWDYCGSSHLSRPPLYLLCNAQNWGIKISDVMLDIFKGVGCQLKHIDVSPSACKGVIIDSSGMVVLFLHRE